MPSITDLGSADSVLSSTLTSRLDVKMSTLLVHTVSAHVLTGSPPLLITQPCRCAVVFYLRGSVQFVLIEGKLKVWTPGNWVYGAKETVSSKYKPSSGKCSLSTEKSLGR